MGRREAFPENTGAAASAVTPRLPLSALLAMAMSGFVAILSETLPACCRKSARGWRSARRWPGSWSASMPWVRYWPRCRRRA